jgi:hypothetical protein
MLVTVGPPDTADMTERFRNAGPCRAEMRREDFTVRRYVITSLCAMADGNHMVLFDVNARRNITPPTAFEVFVDGRYVDRHLGHVVNVRALRDEGGGLDVLGQVEGLLTGGSAAPTGTPRPGEYGRRFHRRWIKSKSRYEGVELSSGTTTKLVASR